MSGNNCIKIRSNSVGRANAGGKDAIYCPIYKEDEWRACPLAEIIDDNAAVNRKMKAFLELEEMLVPLSQELDCEKELAKAREEKYGYLD